MFLEVSSGVHGERAAGPVGAVVGGVVDGVAGVLGVDERPRFHSYVVEQRRPSYEYGEDLRVGAGRFSRKRALHTTMCRAVSREISLRRSPREGDRLAP